jgi:hypothetical protein
MTSSAIDVHPVIATLSEGMVDKLQYACETYIKELLLLKKDEDEKGNVEKYSWLNIEEYQHVNRHSPIGGLIEEMFSPHTEEANEMRVSIISDYFVVEDIPMLKNFGNNYFVDMYNYTQEKCETIWKRRMLDRRNTPLDYLNMVSEMAMYVYMDLNEDFVFENLYGNIDTNVDQLK